LLAGPGADTVEGGDGADRFRFADSASGPGGDRILDFAPGLDRIEAAATAFLPAGPLDPARLANGAPTLAGPQFVYGTASGVLSFDPDGMGAGAALVLATLVGAPALSASDILVIG
jgi:Ca2+-binding RTX toxin-like protein